MLPFVENRWNVAAFLLLASASLLVIAVLGRTVVSDLNSLNAAQHDDIGWNMSQLEVEALKFQSELYKLRDSQDQDLSDLRHRFDLLFSRVGTFKYSRMRRVFDQEAVFSQHFSSVENIMGRLTTLVDGPDPALRAAREDMLHLSQALRADLRQIALVGVEHFAKIDAALRARIALTLSRLALAVFILFSTLALLVAVLLVLYRRAARISAENNLVKSRFEAMVRASLDAVIVADSTGKIVEFNGAAEDVFGYGRDDVVGRVRFGDILLESQHNLMSDLFRAFEKNGNQTQLQTGRKRGQALRKSGQPFPIEYSMCLTNTGAEQVCVSFLRDITLEVTREEDLRMARDEAQAGEKLKSDLLTVMSHEIRTPLNGILGSVSLLEESDLSDQQARHLKAIEVSGDLLLSHVNNVLTLSSINSQSREEERVTFDLYDCVSGVADSLHPNAIERGNRLIVTMMTAKDKWVIGRKTALQQCLVNLIGNAIKFTRDGHITVEVEELAEQGLFEFRVSDTGTGIAPDNLTRIFEEFVMVDTSYDRETAGSGLGLPITRHLVEDMGGTIRVQSLLDEGSLFTISLPLQVASPESALQDTAPSKAVAPAAGLKVLVVDDNEINRMVLTDMLGQLQVDSEEAPDGYAALARMQERRFDLVLLDISMPGIDGIETLARLRASDIAWSDVPAIAVTALATQDDRRVIQQAGFAGILIKPYTLAELSSVIEGALEGAETPRLPSGDPKGPPAEFQMRFGVARFQKETASLLQDLLELQPDLKAMPLSKPVKAELHRLAGTAGVLQLQDLMHCLQQLSLNEDDKQSTAHAQLDSLIEQLNELVESWAGS